MKIKIDKGYKTHVNRRDEKASIHNYKIEDLTVNSRRVRSFHSMGSLDGNKNVIVGTLGGGYFVINMICSEPRIIMDADFYYTYRNPNFIWLSKKRTGGVSEGYIKGSGGYLVNLPTNSYIKVRNPPEKIDAENIFNSGNYIIRFSGNQFEKVKKSEDASESSIKYKDESDFEGELESRKPVTDMRELDHVKWSLFVDKIVEKIPYIKTEKQAREWLNGDKEYGPTNQDMRDAIDRHLSKDEFNKIKQNL